MSRSDRRRRIIALTAPSGAGKTTIAKRVLAEIPEMQFSVSATTRSPRPHERDGVDYHFVTVERFRDMIESGELVEFEEVYPGRYYGTLRSEIETKTANGPVLLDVDVRGAANVERLYGDDALTVFIRPPSLEDLATRLRERKTESEESIHVRLQRAEMELAQSSVFDAVVVNDRLEDAVAETLQLIRSFLDS
ncbi:MAG TPA: guanylate kinase [Rhodothermales bacterium]